MYESLIDELKDKGQWSECSLSQLPAIARAMRGYLTDKAGYQVLEKNSEQLWATLQFSELTMMGIPLTDTRVRFSMTDDGNIPLTVSIMLEDYPGLHFLESLLPIKLGHILYSIRVPAICYPPVLSAAGEVELKDEQWELEVTHISGTGSFTVNISGGKEKQGYSLEELCKLVGIGDFLRHLPDELTAAFSRVLLEEVEVAYNFEDKRVESFAVAMGIDAEWQVFQGFCIKDPGCRLKISYLHLDDNLSCSSFFVSVKGSFEIGDECIPVTLEYDEGNKIFSVLIQGEKPVALPDLSQLSHLIGDIDLSSRLPEGYRSSGLLLHKLGICFQCGGNGLLRFFFDVGLEAEWKLFGNLCVHELVLHYDHGSGEDSVMFGGKFSVEDTEFAVSVQKEAGKYLLFGAPVNPLTISVEEICAFLGFTQIPAVYPVRLSLLDIKLEWDTRTDTMYIGLREGHGKLFLYRRKEEQNTKYLFGIGFNDRIALKDMPFAGNYAGLLEDPGIDKMYLLIASEDMKPDCSYLPELNDVTAAKGVSFLSVLSAAGEERACVFRFTPQSGGKKLLAGQAGGNSILEIHKTAGPFVLNKISLSFADGVVWFAVDAGIQLNGFQFILEGLGAGYSLADKTVAFTLNGLLADIRTGTFSLGGSLLKKTADTYEGSLLLQAGYLTLTAFGGYEKKNFTSVYAWACLNAQIGGPPCFYVTGIAAGFGYNRGLYIPPIEQLEDCPLIKSMSGGIGPEDMDSLLPVEQGESWFGAGVAFQSFKMVDSVAVLTVALGKDTEVNLVGRSCMTIPFGANENASPIAKAVLLLRGSFRKSEGRIAVEAALASDSYILSRDCRIGGQFAYYSWFNGDFVLTLGGYRSGYRKPEQYPDVPRLSLNWNLSDSIHVQGSIYFALTPSCVMAGGELDLLFHAANIKAWFHANVDIYLAWQPYSYDIQVQVNIGVQVDLWLCKVRVEVGCGLHIWGPDFAGVARVELWCVSFSIPFGKQGGPRQNYIDVPTFISSFLTAPQNRIEGRIEAGNAAFKGSDITLVGGLMKQQEKEDLWKINAEELRIQVKTPVPCSRIEGLKCAGPETRDGFTLRTCRNTAGGVVKISPMLTIVIEREDKGYAGDFIAAPIEEEVPAALWAAEDYSGETIAAWTGAVITVAPGDCPCKNCSTDILPEAPDHISLTKTAAPEREAWEHEEYNWIQHLKDVNAGRAAENRQDILKALHMEDIPMVLEETAREPENLFSDSIQVATTGER